MALPLVRDQARCCGTCRVSAPVLGQCRVSVGPVSDQDRRQADVSAGHASWSGGCRCGGGVLVGPAPVKAVYCWCEGCAVSGAPAPAKRMQPGGRCRWGTRHVAGSAPSERRRCPACALACALPAAPLGACLSGHLGRPRRTGARLLHVRSLCKRGHCLAPPALPRDTGGGDRKITAEDGTRANRASSGPQRAAWGGSGGVSHIARPFRAPSSGDRSCCERGENCGVRRVPTVSRPALMLIS